MRNYAPIAYFVYNRPDKTKLSIEALNSNNLAKFSDLFIFSDGAKNNNEDKKKVEEVRRIIKDFKNFRNIFFI